MVFEKLKELICDEFEIEPEFVAMESSFLMDLDVDSIDLVDLGMTVEDEFNVELPFEDEDLEKIKTVGDLVKYIEANK